MGDGPLAKEILAVKAEVGGDLETYREEDGWLKWSKQRSRWGHWENIEENQSLIRVFGSALQTPKGA